MQGEFRNVWKVLAVEVLELCKQNLMGNSDQSSRDQNAPRSGDSKGQTHSVSGGNEDSTGNSTRDDSCFAMAKFVYLCPEVCQDVDFKGSGLIYMMEKI